LIKINEVNRHINNPKLKSEPISTKIKDMTNLKKNIIPNKTIKM
jgi:hypothetical protein